LQKWQIFHAVWQTKERGVSERSIDYDLRGILLLADKAKREEIRVVLLREDSERHKWVRNLKVQDHNSISMPKGHGIALTPLKGAKLSFIEGKLES
jgi:hypothetical protein